MKAKHSDLIAIANTGLAKKLKKAERKQTRLELATVKNNDNSNSLFQDEVWKAVYGLNILRYLLALTLITTIGITAYNSHLKLITPLNPNLFLVSTLLLLISAIIFSYLSRQRFIGLGSVTLAQFTLDAILATLLCHSVGGISSNFTLLFFMIVATGSIVLTQKQALGLAAGTIILMFYEHIYSVITSPQHTAPEYQLMFRYGILLFVGAWLISYLAQRLRTAELKGFTPDTETIEEYLTRQEINALESALNSTAGNKTKAAKRLGLTFRSFRYKLAKYDIE